MNGNFEKNEINDKYFINFLTDNNFSFSPEHKNFQISFSEKNSFSESLIEECYNILKTNNENLAENEIEEKINLLTNQIKKSNNVTKELIEEKNKIININAHLNQKLKKLEKNKKILEDDIIKYKSKIINPNTNTNNNNNNNNKKQFGNKYVKNEKMEKNNNKELEKEIEEWNKKCIQLEKEHEMEILQLKAVLKNSFHENICSKFSSFFDQDFQDLLKNTNSDFFKQKIRQKNDLIEKIQNILSVMEIEKKKLIDSLQKQKKEIEIQKIKNPFLHSKHSEIRTIFDKFHRLKEETIYNEKKQKDYLLNEIDKIKNENENLIKKLQKSHSGFLFDNSDLLETSESQIELNKNHFFKEKKLEYLEKENEKMEKEIIDWKNQLKKLEERISVKNKNKPEDEIIVKTQRSYQNEENHLKEKLEKLENEMKKISFGNKKIDFFIKK